MATFAVRRMVFLSFIICSAYESEPAWDCRKTICQAFALAQETMNEEAQQGRGALHLPRDDVQCDCCRPDTPSMDLAWAWNVPRNRSSPWPSAHSCTEVNLETSCTRVTIKTLTE